MKFFVTNAVGLLAVLSLLGGGMQAARAADINCKAGPGTPIAIVPNMSISGTYSGNDMQVGTTIYRNTFHISLVNVTCDDYFSLDSYMTANSTPSGGGSYMDTDNGRKYVYPTNVPGVGVALWYAGRNYTETRTKDLTITPGDNPDKTSLDISNYGPDISLIKTGPIASGSVVNASSFPHLTWDIATGGVNIGYAGLPIHLADISFAGSIRFVTQTCTPQNRTVDMGKWNAANFKGKGSESGPWMDASIQLTGCPTFSGYYGKDNPQSSVDSGTASGGTRVANLFTLSVTPAHGLVDSANSIMALESGTDAATGLGVQLKYGKVINAGIGEMADTWKSGTSWDVPAPTDGSGSFKLPLAVIYYQTADRVTPGKANTQFTVNIDYK
ncbi:fimbrial protein [Klebsiella aerogenes]